MSPGFSFWYQKASNVKKESFCYTEPEDIFCESRVIVFFFFHFFSPVEVDPIFVHNLLSSRKHPPPATIFNRLSCLSRQNARPRRFVVASRRPDRLVLVHCLISPAKEGSHECYTNGMDG
jgi:hypothetical protein